MFFNLLTDLIGVAVALGVIIFIHEMGHLLVAKAFGIRVTTFSLGFGPRLWGFQRGDTDYRVSAVPLGGYVKLGGEVPEEATGDPAEFLSRPRWQRIAVYLAGPTMNIVLAVVLIAAVFMAGTVIPNLPGMPPIVGGVEEGSSAAAAGLAADDRIVAIGGQPVDNWPDVTFALITSPERPVHLTVERDGRTFEATVTPKKEAKYETGDLAGLLPRLLLTVTEVQSDGAGARAGLKSGDKILTADGKPVTNAQAFVDYILAHPGVPVALSLLRDGKATEVSVVPAAVGGSGKIGVGIGFYQRYGFVDAFAESLRYNAQIVRQTFAVIGKIFSRQISARSALAGPIEIAAQSGAALRTGFRYLLYLMGFISISIALVNLLPIPILDGGQIFILLIEGLIRRDLSMRLKEMVAQVGFVLIVLLMLTVIYFDLAKRWPPSFLSGS
jgi:regulator of sigma E protease